MGDGYERQLGKVTGFDLAIVKKRGRNEQWAMKKDFGVLSFPIPHPPLQI
jgi:hypothetical protein